MIKDRCRMRESDLLRLPRQTLRLVIRVMLSACLSFPASVYYAVDGPSPILPFLSLYVKSAVMVLESGPIKVNMLAVHCPILEFYLELGTRFSEVNLTRDSNDEIKKSNGQMLGSRNSKGLTQIKLQRRKHIQLHVSHLLNCRQYRLPHEISKCLIFLTNLAIISNRWRTAHNHRIFQVTKYLI